MSCLTFQEKDPFSEDLNQEITIGSVQVFLQPIAYMVNAVSILNKGSFINCVMQILTFSDPLSFKLKWMLYLHPWKTFSGDFYLAFVYILFYRLNFLNNFNS